MPRMVRRRHCWRGRCGRRRKKARERRPAFEAAVDRLVELVLGREPGALLDERCPALGVHDH
jgi:hypothetical protein